MILSSYITTLLLCLPVAFSQTEVYCNKAFECANQSIIALSGGLGRVDGHGYKSNYGPESSIQTDNAILHGSFAARYAASISATQFGLCLSTFSCADVQSFTTTSDDIQCYGANSCQNANIFSGDILLCIGTQSCKDTIINDTDVIVGDGAYSLQNAIIDGGGFDIFTIGFYGHHAGYNTTIYCYGGIDFTCVVICYGNSCYGTQLVCQDATCDEYAIECDENDGVTCPIMILNKNSNNDLYNNSIITTNIATTFDAFYDEIDMSTIVIENNDACDLQKDKFGTFVFDDNRENVNISNLTIVNANGHVCCRGRSACEGADIIEVTEDDKHIICSGRSGCELADGLITNNKGGDIHCNSIFSCRDVNEINAYNDGSIYCTAGYCCTNSKMYNASNLYCTGGFDTCLNVTTSGVENIYLMGFPRLAHNATFNTSAVGDNSGRTMNVYLSGHQVGYYVTIICGRNDTCTIYCLTFDACSGQNTIVIGGYDVKNLTVVCEDNNECPFVIRNTDAPSVDPTLAPTFMPTISPTDS